MFILVTVQAQEFPVTTVGWVVVVVVVLMMHCEIAEFLPAELPATARATRRTREKAERSTRSTTDSDASSAGPAEMQSRRDNRPALLRRQRSLEDGV